MRIMIEKMSLAMIGKAEAAKAPSEKSFLQERWLHMKKFIERLLRGASSASVS